jgi:uncharacterized protein YabN with tetrapyrrole methylase and pyrophosphatase domain
MQKGSLMVVGTGLQLRHVTQESAEIIKNADKVLFIVADPVTETWITEINSTAESLKGYYAEGKNRLITYKEMVAQIMKYVHEKLNVCAVFYGHPGVFAFPSHESIRQAKAEGYDARMFPSVSAEDCLFSDLGIDPSTTGCQSFEVTDFLVYKRNFDTSCSLILWQIGAIGDIAYKGLNDQQKHNNIQILSEYLQKFYKPSHEIIIYEASQFCICDPVIQKIPLCKLASGKITGISTLYIPPQNSSSTDKEMLLKLGIR